MCVIIKRGGFYLNSDCIDYKGPESTLKQSAIYMDLYVQLRAMSLIRSHALPITGFDRPGL